MKRPMRWTGRDQAVTWVRDEGRSHKVHTTDDWAQWGVCIKIVADIHSQTVLLAPFDFLSVYFMCSQLRNQCIHAYDNKYVLLSSIVIGLICHNAVLFTVIYSQLTSQGPHGLMLGLSINCPYGIIYNALTTRVNDKIAIASQGSHVTGSN